MGCHLFDCRVNSSLLKDLKMPHAKDTKGVKFSEENPLRVLRDLYVKLLQQAVSLPFSHSFGK